MKLVLAALVLAAAAPTANADCAIPMWIGTPSGTTIPEHGTLYIYDSGFRWDDYGDEKGVTFSDGIPHAWAETRISPDVIRVDYAAGLATSMKVGVGWDPVTFAIDPHWKAPAAAPRVMQYWHHVSEWTCSTTDSWMFQIDQPVAAFRVRWVHGDNVIQYIEPAQTAEGGRAALEIGKHNCIGMPSVPLEELAAGGELTLTAIRFDATEVPVTGVPKFLRTDMLRTSEDGVVGAIGYLPQPPAPPAPPPLVTNAASGHVFLGIAAAALGLLFVGLLLAGRPRTPTPLRM